MRFPKIEEKIPAYLHPFIAKQNPDLYTAMDHATWRYILRVSKKFFAEHAHKKYLDGLEETGISTENIPLISDMDLKLQKFGWRAVAVVGFIPPAVFMEFLSLGVLPIACDIRQIEHLSYTPAPDIVHEAAGHAPIVADPEYADYLHAYGEIARKVIFSKQDMNVYEAIRELSDIKEDPSSTASQIQAAEQRLEKANAEVDFVSEATILSRMGWWTFEYGLIGDLKNPKIYGAGLLSSLAESYNCFSKEVHKIPFSIKCIDQTYDITKPQPQLFVTPDFKVLTQTLEELASQMAYRHGGIEGLEKAKQAETVTTIQFENDLQVSGILESYILNSTKDKPIFLKLKGPTQISFLDSEIPGQDAKYHSQGYSTPLGKVKTPQGYRDLSALSESEIKALGSLLQFESGIVLKGNFKKSYREQNLTLVASFEDVEVRYEGMVLYRPEWGPYDVLCSENIRSVFGGAADRAAYFKSTGGFSQKQHRQKSNLTAENKGLNHLYEKVRKLRESGTNNSSTEKELSEVLKTLNQKYPNDWLLRLELLEFKALPLMAQTEIKNDLKKLTQYSELIERGLKL